jgi:nucleoside recognition membrane protein YjiH
MYEWVSFTCAFWVLFYIGVLMEKFNKMICDNRREGLFDYTVIVVSFW